VSVLTSDELMAVVRVHADRVHDAVRRLGCGPDASVRVVQQSALELVEAAGHRSSEVTDPVGWWFTRARSLGRKATTEDDELPLGGGVLSTDAYQVRLAEALESRPERERAALLLRDSYDLPLPTVATVLALDEEAAAELVAQARLSFLPLLTTTPAVPHSDHVAQLGPLGRVAEGGAVAARETSARRHVQGCASCAAIVDAQERARRLLSGLTVVAMPDGDREVLLARVEDRARPLLPVAEPLEDEDWDDEPSRGYSLSLMALGLVLAVGAGAGVGALASRGDPITALTDQRSLPLVTAAPVLNVRPAPSVTATASPTPSPSPRVFVVTPSPTPTPTATVTVEPTATDTAQPTTLVLDPTSGPADTQITVTGEGWTPGSQILVQFHNAFGNGAGATAQAVADPQGTFTTTIAAHDNNQNFVGPHTVSADDGMHHAETTFTTTQP
jgi:DNA-directed RNA polymerase specialized sigma24 family protein